MSSSKKKSTGSLQEIYSSIMERLSKCKPLIDNPISSNWSSISQELAQVATLAETFTEQRRKSVKGTGGDLADSLDQEGVNLWNISGVIRRAPDGDENNINAHIAALRLAAFRLVEAGLEIKPGIETLIHVLQLANKTGTSFIEVGNTPVAASVLISAAQYEEQLKTANCSDDTHRRAIASATVMFFCTRMEVAWKEGNHSVAEYLSRKITDDSQHLGQLPPHHRKLLAYKFHEVGQSVLQQHSSQNGLKASDAEQWLQKSFSIAEQLEDSAVGASQLKISILRTMARAYFLSESYDRAEAVLDELVPTVDSQDHAKSEYQELRWLRLAVLKRRKAGDPSLLDAFKSIVDHMDFSEASITEVLQELRTLGTQHPLVTAVHQHCLELALRRHTTEPAHIHRLILSLILHASKDKEHTRGVKAVESTFTLICDADIELPSIPATACLTLFWQYGGRYYKARKWSEAADWYLAGTHKLFRASGPSSASKCFRKAALCYIAQREYGRASMVIRRCAAKEAPTHYVTFLIAIHQGLEDQATQAIHDMLEAPDFDRKMLLLATQISHQSEMKLVLLAVLESLLKTLKIGPSEGVVEALTLVRCIVRLILGLLSQPAANKPALIDNVVNQFRTARILTEAAATQKATPLVLKDISWLWRTAYNCAVQGCSEWGNANEQISELFDIARELLEACCQASPVSMDADTCLHLANASFAAVSGRVLFARECMSTSGNIDDEQLRAVSKEIKLAKTRIADVLNKEILTDTQDSYRIQYFLHALRLFDAEFAAYRRAWNDVSHVVEELVDAGPSAVGTYEAIADILWMDQACPVNLLYQCLESILRASLNHGSLSVEKFSRWLRTICTISLSRNTVEDTTRAIGYAEQAVSVMEDHNGSHNDDGTYPMDEREWLFAKAFNTGTDCLQSSMFDEAKRWFEVATIICRFLPAGKERANQISETYATLLSHYEPKTKSQAD